MRRASPNCRRGPFSARRRWRRAQVKFLRPDIETVEFRGNVETRLNKLRSGIVHATFLAAAGLKRLGLAAEITSVIEPEVMLPAVAQGAIGIEMRENDGRIASFIEPLNHRDTAIAVTCERAFLGMLDGSCRTPIAGLCVVEGSNIRFRGMVLALDGSDSHEVVRSGNAADAEELGKSAGEEILASGSKAFFTDAS